MIRTLAMWFSWTLCAATVACGVNEAEVADTQQRSTAPSGYLERAGTQLSIDGQPYRALGFNKVELFRNYLGQVGTEADGRAALDDAKRAGVSYLRFNASGYYPAGMALYEQDRAAYWAVLDRLVADAKQRGVKLVPVIWWNQWLIPDMVWSGRADEHVALSEVFVAGSAARQLLYSYAKQLVTRYRDDQTILFWELTNEMNLLADIDIADDNGVATNQGTQPARTAADNFQTHQMVALLADLARKIKGWDPHHLISTGFTRPRRTAWGLKQSPEMLDPQGFVWPDEDSEAQMKAWVAFTHPEPIDIVSMHFYNGDDPDDTRYQNEYPGWTSGDYTGKHNPDVLRVFQQAASAIGKPLYLGEYADKDPWVRGADGYPADPRGSFTRRTLLEILDLRIPLSSIWTWHYAGDNAKTEAFSVSSGHSALMDELIATFGTVDSWLRSAPSSPSVRLPVAHPGFEQDSDRDGRADGWETVWRSGSSAGWSARRASGDAFAGTYKLRLDSGGGDAGSQVHALSDAIAVSGGTLILSAALKTSLASGAKATMKLLQYDSGGTKLAESGVTAGPGGGWKYEVETLRVDLRADTRSVKIRFSVGGAADQLLDVDDVRLSHSASGS